jgi:hypothetical protein
MSARSWGHAQARHFVHADKDRCADWHTAMPDLANQGRLYPQRAAQGGVVFQLHAVQ